MLGVILANQATDALEPMTHVVPHALLPVFDKPLVYYPLSLFMRAGIRDVVVLARSRGAVERVLGDGSSWGLRISYGFVSGDGGALVTLDVGTYLHGEPLDERLERAIRDVDAGSRRISRLLEHVELDGLARFDCSSPEGLIEASQYVQVVQRHHNELVASPEEIAYRRGWISTAQLDRLIEGLGKTDYASALRRVTTGL